MSDWQQGPGWWYASDGKWYPPASTPQPPTYQQAEPLWRQPKAPREAKPKRSMGETMVIYWAVGSIIGFFLAVGLVWWFLSGVDFG